MSTQNSQRKQKGAHRLKVKNPGGKRHGFNL